MANDSQDSINLQQVTFNLVPLSLHGSASETLWAEPIGNNAFRLRNTPFYVYGVSAEDIVLALRSDGILIFDSVIQHSGHSTYRIIVQDTMRFRDFWTPLQSLGCTYEEGQGGLFAIDVPPDADIYAVFKHLEAGEKSMVWGFEEGHCSHNIA